MMNFKKAISLFSILLIISSSAFAEVHKKKYHKKNKSHNKMYVDLITDDYLNYEPSYNGHVIADPYESLNRKIFEFNNFVDSIALEPAAKLYGIVIPEFGRHRIHDALSNLTEPVSFINNVLQGNFKSAINNLMRFLVNSTIGLFGFMDIASLKPELQPTKATFSHTLAHNCIDIGNYLVIPILGASSTRDVIALGVDVASDPFNYILSTDALYVINGTKFIHTRHENIENLKTAKELSFDQYSFIKSIYAQKAIKSKCNK